MGVRSRPFGKTPCGQQTLLFELALANGFSVGVTDFGAALQHLNCRDRSGSFADIALGYRDAAQMKHDCGYLGAAIGRIAGRISQASFTLRNRTYRLTRNNGEHHLHGGLCGFSHRLWTHAIAKDGTPSITFSLQSDEGDQGYPGCIEASLSYWLEPPARLVVEFSAIADRETPFNPTLHAYFNLDGHDAGSINDHELQLHATRRTLTDQSMIPTGVVELVSGTQLDFALPRRIAAQPISFGGGFDQNFIVDAPAGRLREVAVLTSRRSGRRLSVETDRPCIHLYTGGFLDVASAKDDASYGPGSGLSLETQGYPDAVNQPVFPVELVSPDRPFRSRTIYTFTTENFS
jgi:aldose 1-epimerase